MADAYSGLTRAYDELFPVNPRTIAYLGRAGLAPGARILDVGCASGAHPRAFAAAGYAAEGIDPSEAMIRAAREAAAGSAGGGAGAPSFKIAGMLDLARLYPGGSWDAVTCLGNTLPHLRGPAEAAEFLSQVRAVLSPGGFLVLQFLNYRKILAEKPSNLPRLETRDWIFERSYRYGRGYVEFDTRLSDREGRILSEGTVRLSPLRFETVVELAESWSFRAAALEAGWDGEPFDPDSSTLAVLRLSLPA